MIVYYSDICINKIFVNTLCIQDREILVFFFSSLSIDPQKYGQYVIQMSSYNVLKNFSTQNFQKPTGENFSTRPQNCSQRFAAKRPTKPGANYFYTHCKVQGHSIDRCFQIHGFPPGFKGSKDRRPAVVVVNQNFNNDNQHISQDAATVPDSHQSPLFDEQYTQLISLLNK